jgi:bla regulator protein BlaR1
MDALPLILASAHLIGWTLVHFVWQGVLLGLVYAAVRAVLPRGEVRYRFGMAMLMALALCPLLTVWRMLEAPSSVVLAAGAMVSSTAIGEGAAATDSTWTWDSGLDAALPWLVLAWSLGVLLLSLRAWRQWRGLKALVRMAEQLPLWQVRVNDMAKRFGLRRRVTVLCSKVIATPALVGWMRPVILLPMAVACSFPVAQVELILAHELAHLRRWDPLANLFQVVLETVYFYHPVVHWISRDVRNEREICSDELALSISGGDRHEFVAALAELGELRERHGSLLLAASGGVLLDRVQHMVLPIQEATRARTPARFVAVLLGAVLVSLTLRLEWRQAQLQRNLTESIMQLQSMIAPSWLPLAQLHVAWHLPDLAPAHAVVARPLADTPFVITTPGALTSPSATTVAILPHPAPLLVSDLVPAHGVSLARVAEPVDALASSVPPMPMPIRMRQPIYPQNALARGIEGQVVLEFGLAIDGSVQDLHVINAQPADVFDQAAIQAMRGWKYALPSDALTQRRYRQTLVFTLNAATRGSASSSTQAGDEVQARVGCQVATGTLICRLPGDPDSHAAGAGGQQ